MKKYVIIILLALIAFIAGYIVSGHNAAYGTFIKDVEKKKVEDAERQDNYDINEEMDKVSEQLSTCIERVRLRKQEIGSARKKQASYNEANTKRKKQHYEESHKQAVHEEVKASNAKENREEQQQTEPIRSTPQPSYTPEYGTRDVWVDCFSCRGTGDCSACHGNGYSISTWSDGSYNSTYKCPVCFTSGRCQQCYGMKGHYEKQMYQIR